MQAMAMGGAAAVMVVADRALAMEVPAYRHPPVPSWRRSSGATTAPVMTALVEIRCLSPGGPSLGARGGGVSHYGAAVQGLWRAPL
jgi:hypothetical protein